jgi:hypothetical protein
MNKIIYTCCLLGLSLCVFAQNLQTISVNISNGNDDIEVSTTKYVTSADLELGGFDSGNLGKQYVALRFQNVLLPANAQISNAYLQFTTKVGNPRTATVHISCQQGNAPAYVTTENLLTRPYVSNQIVWNSPAWFVTGESGANQKTPNLAALLNAAIASNWASGNALSFILQGNATTNDVLNAKSFENNATHAGAPQLIVEYFISGGSNTINMADLTHIFVNEVAPKGTSLLKEDWIELYNGNDVAVFTDSLYITGKKTQPFKWRLKNLMIPAKGFLRLIADKDTALGFAHIDMKLSAAGEKFFLFKNVNGAPVELTSFEFPALDVDNVTFGTITDGILNPNATNLVTFLGGTPNATNVGGKQFFKMSNNAPRGILQQPITVTLSAPANATIRYTTDFSQPSRTNGMIYTQPIAITNTTVLKTFAYTAIGETVVEIFTYINPVKGTELHFPNLVSQADYETGLKHLPIVSISTSAGAADSKVEKICGFEYINKFGTAGSVGILAGVEGYGNDSYIYSEQKNLRVKFKSIYGFSKLAYPIFEKDEADAKAPTTEFDVLELKIGQDGPNEDGYGMLMSSQGLVSKTMRELGNVDLHTRYVHAFINGKYHGVYTLKEKYDQHLGATYYGGQKEQYDVIESAWTAGTVNEGTITNWNALKTATTQNNFQTVKNYLNVSQFIDFMMVMMYFDNEWEYRAVADRNLVTTKFVFEDHDTDGALTKTIDENVYNYQVKWTDPTQLVFNGPAGMFGNLLRSNNKEFQTLVRDRVYEAMQLPNAPLTPARIQTKLEALKTSLYPAFWMELARFNRTLYNNNPYFDEEYNGNVTHLPTRYQYNLNKWLEKGLAHTLSPVIFSQPSGTVTGEVTATNPNHQGIVYYTVDGSDPMGNDGIVNPLAKAYSSALELKTGANTVVARVYLNSNFGPKAKAIYTNSAPLRHPIKSELADDKSFTIAPNPVYDYVDIDMTAANAQSVELTIYNHLGEPLLKQSVEHATDSYRFALDGLNTGQYILTIQVEGQGRVGRKLIINR